ncbi:putative membrane protein YmcC [Flexivirga endophytica]|uniref:Membrane protein YmcC n=1 Tax=Flexivirga endophytica TaxID=1849103 RepID=A0A916T7J3_9MICO|nr:hypothetical protein [Flexivirga endophytica]GGB33699.1 putative membrane protein YmcC [Flexivirga endophytica]GHB41700.1 putative membrane protein YmcC [Flexivirga endophytica]
MLIGVIVACEIGFWLFLLAGLSCRYLLRRQRLSNVLLALAPAVDLVLLIATVLDLQQGGEATAAHGLAAIYIGVSVGFGHRMLQWADVRFAHRFAGGPPPAPKPKYGAARAAFERSGWYAHLRAYAVGAALLGLAIVAIHDASRTEALLNTLQLWTLVLAIDAVISFSYTFFPKKAPSARA